MEDIRKCLVTVGDLGCGKTSLHYIMQGGECIDDIAGITFFHDFDALVMVNEKNVTLHLIDTVPLPDYDRLRPVCYPYADVILMCFSIDKADSLENIRERWMPEVKPHSPNVPIILVCNKMDLRHDSFTIRELAKMQKVPMTTAEGQIMAEKIGALAYLECSAKTKRGISELMETAARAAIQVKKNKFSKCLIV